MSLSNSCSLGTSLDRGCTYGAVRDLYATCYAGGKIPYIPRLRIIDGKRLAGNGGERDKWKLSITDGATAMLGVTGKAVTEMLDSGQMTIGCLFDLVSYTVVKLSEGTRVCYIIDVGCLDNHNDSSRQHGVDHCFAWEGGVTPGRGQTKSTADKRIALPCTDNETARGNEPPRKRWRCEY